MALDLSALTNYVKENELQLTSAAIFSVQSSSSLFWKCQVSGNPQIMTNQARTREAATISDQFNNQAAEKRIKNFRDPAFYCCWCMMHQGWQ